jgi:hypothetical protein
VSAPVLSGAAWANHELTFTLSGTAGSKYVVQASTNPSASAWVSLATNPAPFVFVDTNASKFAQRFYRSAVVP